MNLNKITNCEILLDKLLKTNIVVNNEYLIKYVNLIFSNINTQNIKDVTQRHHIIPRYYYKSNNMNVDNSKSNIVNLKYTDHILAHYYLALCSNTEENRLKNENAICRVSRSTIDYIKENIDNLDMFQDLYNECQEHNRKTHLGKTHTISDETKEKISKSNSNRYVGYIHIYKDDETEKIIPKEELDYYLNNGWNKGRCLRSKESLKTNYNYNVKGMLGKSQSDYQKKRVSEVLKGVNKSQETRNNMSKARLGKILVSNDITRDSKYIEKDSLDDYIKIGYHKGKLKSTLF